MYSNLYKVTSDFEMDVTKWAEESEVGNTYYVWRERNI